MIKAEWFRYPTSSTEYCTGISGIGNGQDATGQDGHCGRGACMNGMVGQVANLN
jgi:hypothetical protein